MSTEYYLLRKPITSLRLEPQGRHFKLSIWINHALAGELVLSDELSEVLTLFMEREGAPALQRYWGGLKEGVVVKENVKNLCETQQVISEYGELTTVGEVRKSSCEHSRSDERPEGGVGKASAGGHSS